MRALASVRSDAAARVRASRLTPHLLLLFTYLIWSVNPVLVKIGLEHVHPLAFVAVRFTIGGLMLMAIAAITRRAIWPPPPLRVLLPTALIGIVANQLGFTYSVQLTTVVNLSILMGLSPMLASGLLILVAHRRPPGRRPAPNELLNLVDVISGPLHCVDNEGPLPILQAKLLKGTSGQHHAGRSSSISAR